MLRYDRYLGMFHWSELPNVFLCRKPVQIPSTAIPFYVYPEVEILHISQSIAHSREHIACLNLWVDNGSQVFSPAGASQSVGWGLGANWIQFPCGCSRCLFHSSHSHFRSSHAHHVCANIPCGKKTKVKAELQTSNQYGAFRHFLIYRIIFLTLLLHAQWEVHRDCALQT